MSDQSRSQSTPTAGPLRVPAEYGLPDTPGTRVLPWERVRDWIAASKSYWVCTTRPDGLPHAAPVWAVWVDERLFFSTDRRSRKGRNLAARPDLVIHLESGDEVVILEGVAAEVTDPAQLAAFVEAYDVKYQIRPDVVNPLSVVYVLQPREALSWLESDFLSSASRWSFDAD
ncbi:MAG: pyridoxamine 5'-phosphate oxidase family protein [Chloroflexi bacterium]|nr:pyridoxamine 5'-phosphate oxidase family protein [Chloroflexota bacterium]